MTAMVDARSRPARSRPATPSESASRDRSMTVRVARVLLEGVLVAHRLAVGLDTHGRRVDAPGPVRRGTGRARQPTPEHVVRQAGQVADGAHAVIGEHGPGLLAHAPQAPDGQAGRGTPPRVPAGTTTSASGLRRSDAILATRRLLATPMDAVRPELGADGGRMATAIALGRAMERLGAGDIQERLVDGDLLDHAARSAAGWP